MGAQTLDSTSRERESGASMRIRVAARTADLNQIADAGAAALETALKQIAFVMGEDPSEVKVTPNKEFGNDAFTGQMAVEFTTAREGGFPISARSLHDLARKRNLTSRTFEEEIAEAEKEKNSVFKIPEPPKPAPAPGPGGNGPAGNNPPKKA
jgi:hypothetical protein